MCHHGVRPLDEHHGLPARRCLKRQLPALRLHLVQWAIQQARKFGRVGRKDARTRQALRPIGKVRQTVEAVGVDQCGRQSGAAQQRIDKRNGVLALRHAAAQQQRIVGRQRGVQPCCTMRGKCAIHRRQRQPRGFAQPGGNDRPCRVRHRACDQPRAHAPGRAQAQRSRTGIGHAAHRADHLAKGSLVAHIVAGRQQRREQRGAEQESTRGGIERGVNADVGHNNGAATRCAREAVVAPLGRRKGHCIVGGEGFGVHCARVAVEAAGAVYGANVHMGHRVLGRAHSIEQRAQPIANRTIAACAQERIHHHVGLLQPCAQLGKVWVIRIGGNLNTCAGEPCQVALGIMRRVALPEVDTRVRARIKQIACADEAIPAIVARPHKNQRARRERRMALHDLARHCSARLLHHGGVGVARVLGGALKRLHGLHAQQVRRGRNLCTLRRMIIGFGVIACACRVAHLRFSITGGGSASPIS